MTDQQHVYDGDVVSTAGEGVSLGMTTDLLQVLTELPPNSVIYSERAWAAARKSSNPGGNSWFVDSGAHRSPYSLSTKEMIEWTADWVVMVPKGSVA
jgi:hypothetical protein